MTRTPLRMLALLLAAALMLALCGCGEAASTTYTVTVTGQNGQALENVGVYIYETPEKAELVWFGRTDSQGRLQFAEQGLTSYIAVLSDVPVCYEPQEYYDLAGAEAQITLPVASLDDADWQQLYFAPGDTMMDFTVTASDGTAYTLYQLLQEQQAVMLNFWFAGCVPCKLEFPYLQEAYDASDGIAVLAMDPVDDAATVADFQVQNGYSFPMAAVDGAWADLFRLEAYPTTVIIDRSGTVSFIHTGSIDSTETFRAIFDYFTDPNYTPGPVGSLAEILARQDA